MPSILLYYPQKSFDLEQPTDELIEERLLSMLEVEDLERTKRSRSEPQLLSYCLSSPLEVLALTLPRYRIFQYEDIYCPVDPESAEDKWDYHKSGLIIKEAQAPKGTQIVQNFSGIDFSGVEEAGSRDETVMRHHFIATIGHSMSYPLDSHGSMGNYLELYEMRLRERCENPFYEQRIRVLLDIAKVAFKVEKPDVTYLRKTWSIE